MLTTPRGLAMVTLADWEQCSSGGGSGAVRRWRGLRGVLHRAGAADEASATEHRGGQNLHDNG